VDRNIFWWYLVPTTENPTKEVEMYKAAAWEAFEECNENNVSAQQSDRQAFKTFRDTSGAVFFSPDAEPKQPINLTCVLLKRGSRSSLIEDRGIVCESVDLSRNLYRRVGYFDQLMIVNDGNLQSGTSRDESRNSQLGASCSVPQSEIHSFDTSQGDGLYFKSDILKHLGFNRGDETWKRKSSLIADTETTARLLGLSLDDIHEPDWSAEVAPQNLAKVSGQLSLFKDGYEEAEVEII
jgi:hypothetical protein